MPLDPRRRSVQCAVTQFSSNCGLHRMAYLEWGDPRNNDVLVCVHGLTRTGRDFDNLARALAEHYRVVCPDVAGRGDSEWLQDPAFYIVPQYVSDMVTLIARLDVATVHWLGTSLGALVGLGLASRKGSPISKLVLNDAGPLLAKAALERIRAYVGSAPVFPGIEQAEAYIRTVSAPFGPHSDAEWRFLTETVVRKNPDGSLRLHYDPKIAYPSQMNPPKADMDLWSYYEAVTCPTLVLRGEYSDLLSRDTCEQMSRRGPKARTVEIAGVGHAPTLLHADQIEIVRGFLFSEN